MKKKRRKKLADKKLQNTKLYELANTIYNNKETKTLPKQHKNSPELIKKKKKCFLCFTDSKTEEKLSFHTISG